MVTLLSRSHKDTFVERHHRTHLSIAVDSAKPQYDYRSQYARSADEFGTRLKSEHMKSHPNKSKSNNTRWNKSPQNFLWFHIIQTCVASSVHFSSVTTFILFLNYVDISTSILSLLQTIPQKEFRSCRKMRSSFRCLFYLSNAQCML